MSCPRAHLLFSPLSQAASRHPNVLLVGSHQPNLLKSLEGWPKRWSGKRNFLIRFSSPQLEKLARIPDDSFDLVVVGADSAVMGAGLVEQLVRVARQGLINLR